MTTLIHVGVKGMKWGVRKAREKSNDSDREVVLGKGETLHHVSDNPNLKLSKDLLYTSFTKKDVLRYRGEYADQVRMSKNVDKVLDYKLTAKEVLISPSKKKRIDELIALQKDKPAILKELAETNLSCGLILQTAKMLGFKTVEGEAAKYRAQLNSKDPKEQEKAFRDFVKVIPLSKPMRDQYFDRLEKQGFNSIYDDNDILNGYSDKPLIVFNPTKSLSITSKVTDDQKATDQVFSELEQLIKDTQ